MEESLYYYCIDQGAVVVEEVTMPDDQGIVDTLSCTLQQDGSREWRCYELKVTKADFRSPAKLSFVGDYNYFVLPKELYEAMKQEIPSEIGVLLYRPYAEMEDTELLTSGTFTIVKKAKKTPLKVAQEELTNRFMASLFREVRKAKRMEYGVRVFQTEQLYTELKRRAEIQNPFEDKRFYEQFMEEGTNDTIDHLKEELSAVQKEYQELANKRQSARRLPTEPLE